MALARLSYRLARVAIHPAHVKQQETAMNDKDQDNLKQEVAANQRAEDKAGEDDRHNGSQKPPESDIPTHEEDTDASGDAYNGVGEDNHQSGK